MRHKEERAQRYAGNVFRPQIDPGGFWTVNKAS